MRIDVTEVLKEFDGSELEVSAGSAQAVELCAECTVAWREMMRPLTLRLVCTRALSAMTQKSAALPAEEKFRRGQLAHRIYNEDTPSLDAGEITMVKNAIGENDGPLVLMQAWLLLDPPDEPAKKTG